MIERSKVDRWTQVYYVTRTRESTALSRVEASTCVHLSTWAERRW